MPFVSVFLFSLQLQPDAVLILYNFSGQCSGEALITFPSEEIARRAVAERSNHPFYDRQVHLVFCNWPPSPSSLSSSLNLTSHWRVLAFFQKTEHVPVDHRATLNSHWTSPFPTICHLWKPIWHCWPDTPEAAVGVRTSTGEAAEVFKASCGANAIMDVTCSIYVHLL